MLVVAEDILRYLSSEGSCSEHFAALKVKILPVDEFITEESSYI